MTRPIVPAGIELVIHAKQNGSDRMHVIHASAAATHPTAGELQLAAETVAAAIGAGLGRWSTSVTFYTVVATDISQLDGQQYTYTMSPPLQGTQASQALPGNVALVTTFASTHGGRSGHGRVYNFGLTTNGLITPDTVSSSYADIWTSLWQGLSNALTGVGLPMCVFSRKNLALYPLQGVHTDPNLDSQRRRLVGRGR
jgi:hypothetical protein